ncbi:MAG: type II toxin-antitoxin system RelE/ParE family toxin [Candidatus Omnitrophota bacterium]|jgi:phage-related protein
MAFEVYYFLDHRERNPVKEFVISLPRNERTKYFAYLAALSHEGPNLKRPMADYLGSGIYELRPKSNRIFYFFFLKDKIVILHAIKKKTDKIPKEDLAICQRRKVIVEVYQKLEKARIREDA